MAPVAPPDSEVAELLVQQHRRFLDFLVSKVGDRALAEDILQDAFVRGLQRGATLREREALTAWFYRVLRNAVVDHQRRRATGQRVLDQLGAELPEAGPDPEAERVICQCVVELAGSLKPEYAQAVLRMEVEGASVKDYAREAGITPGNAAVRLFRAREALRKRVESACGTCAVHGCVDCTCAASGGSCD
ncbi:MAG: RNA polymerase sigma factor [Planctomycetota bacterium]